MSAISDRDYGRLSETLACCSMLPGSGQKRFVHSVRGLDPARLTERQRAYLDLLAWTFRRQLPRDLVPASKPDQLPPKPRKDAP